ncbi:MAG: site-2 protease family protein, partial [Phycisphaerae bacterium]
MTLLPDNDAAVSPGPRGDRAELDVQQFDWKDVNGTVWSGEVSAQHLRLQSDAQRLALPADTWHKDLYVVPHGRNILVRIETFDCAVRFILPPEQAAPLLRLLDAPPEKDATPDVAVDDTPSPTDLLWPKMSPLAVWALIFSALVFVPFVGLLAAAATVVLLILHRRTVRRAVAWRHSRIVCAASVVFLVGGLVVSALATWGLRQRFSDAAGLAGLAGNAAPNEPTWGVLAGGVFVVLLSLSVHEAAHAIAAWWLGDGLARSLGRVTLSPLAHIDLFGTIILPIMLVVAKMPVFGYARPVPVSVDSLPRRHRAHILISLAGPGSNLLLAAASLMLMLALGCTVRMFAPDAHVSNLAPLDLRAL